MIRWSLVLLIPALTSLAQDGSAPPRGSGKDAALPPWAIDYSISGGIADVLNIFILRTTRMPS